MSDFLNSVTSPQQTSDSYLIPDAPLEDTALNLALTIAHAAEERKAANIRILKVTEVSYIADYFVIVTGFSTAQMRAIARNIEDAVTAHLHRAPLHTEGQLEGGWILKDYGEVIAHIFMPEARDYYGLEAFWGHAEEVPFEAEA